MMRRKTMLLLALITVGPASINLAATNGREKEKKLTEMIHSYRKHEANFDYVKLAGDVHPVTLAAFRRIVDQMLIKMVDEYGYIVVMDIFDGIESLTEVNNLDDQQYWVYIMGTANKFLEKKTWDKPLKILSTFDDSKDLIVTFETIIPRNQLDNMFRRIVNVMIFRWHEGQLKYSGFHRNQAFSVEQTFKLFFKLYMDEIPLGTP